jgi:hypothetical protein
MAKVQNQEKWGKSTAKDRYGSPTGGISGPSQEAPQCPEDKRGPDYDNNTPSNWLRGMPNAEGKPSFDHGGGAKGK